jgi:Rieske Fe-S protein
MICSRRRFLAGALGTGALVAIGPACGPAAVAPDGTVTVTAGQAVLEFARFPALMQTGGGVTVATDGGTPFAVVRTGATTAIAVNAVCTHQGCTAVYHSSLMHLHCDCHGSEFALSGNVLQGPATVALAPTYAATVGATSITVTISA